MTKLYTTINILFSLFILLLNTSCSNTPDKSKTLNADTSSLHDKDSSGHENTANTSHKFYFLSPQANEEKAGDESIALKPFNQQDLEKLIIDFETRGLITSASVYIYQPYLQYKITLHEKELFHAASLMKVPIMMAFLKQAEALPDLLHKELVYHPMDLHVPNNIPVKMIDGNKYSLQDLLHRSIVYSDNDANAMLQKDYLPYEKQKKFYTDFKMPEQAGYPEGDHIALDDYMKFWLALYNATYLSKSHSDYALQMLSESYFREGIVEGLPAGLTIAHKHGQWRTPQGYQLHDCGIIYLGNRTYVVGISTHGKDLFMLKIAIKEFAQYIHSRLAG